MERAPIGCNEEDARVYMGLTPNAFATARRRGIIVPIQKGCYSYHLLDRAMAQLEKEAIKKAENNCKVFHLTHEDEDNSEREERETGPVRGEGPGSSYPKTQELLRKLGQGS